MQLFLRFMVTGGFVLALLNPALAERPVRELSTREKQVLGDKRLPPTLPGEKVQGMKVYSTGGSTSEYPPQLAQPGVAIGGVVAGTGNIPVVVDGRPPAVPSAGQPGAGGAEQLRQDFLEVDD
jgi:hypothetical protein